MALYGLCSKEKGVIKMKKALVLSPHPDDMEYNMGGTVIKMIADGWKVDQMILSTCAEMVGTKFIEGSKKSAEELGVSTLYHDYLNQEFMRQRSLIRQDLHDLKPFNYDIVFVPCRQDWHQDHQVVTEEALRIFRQSTILGWIKEEIFDRHHDLRVDLETIHIVKRIELLQHFGILDAEAIVPEWFEIIQMRNYL